MTLRHWLPCSGADVLVPVHASYVCGRTDLSCQVSSRAAGISQVDWALVGGMLRTAKVVVVVLAGHLHTTHTHSHAPLQPHS